MRASYRALAPRTQGRTDDSVTDPCRRTGMRVCTRQCYALAFPADSDCYLKNHLFCHWPRCIREIGAPAAQVRMIARVLGDDASYRSPRATTGHELPGGGRGVEEEDVSEHERCAHSWPAGGPH